jgi:hypothetical protein
MSGNLIRVKDLKKKKTKRNYITIKTKMININGERVTYYFTTNSVKDTKKKMIDGELDISIGVIEVIHILFEMQRIRRKLTKIQKNPPYTVPDIKIFAVQRSLEKFEIDYKILCSNLSKKDKKMCNSIRIH